MRDLSDPFLANSERCVDAAAPRPWRAPRLERAARGPVAVVECYEEIPCNPCETACPVGAITVGEPITRPPVLDDEKCTGCGLCVAGCPGMAIFMLDASLGSGQAVVGIPHEFLPRVEKRQEVEVTDRLGRTVGRGTVVRVVDLPANDRTVVVYVAVPSHLMHEVRGIR